MLSPGPSSHTDRWQISGAPPSSAQSTGAVRQAARHLICLLLLHLGEMSESSNDKSDSFTSKTCGRLRCWLSSCCQKKKNSTRTVRIPAQLKMRISQIEVFTTRRLLLFALLTHAWVCTGWLQWRWRPPLSESVDDRSWQHAGEDATTSISLLLLFFFLLFLQQWWVQVVFWLKDTRKKFCECDDWDRKRHKKLMVFNNTFIVPIDSGREFGFFFSVCYSVCLLLSLHLFLFVMQNSHCWLWKIIIFVGEPSSLIVCNRPKKMSFLVCLFFCLQT